MYNNDNNNVYNENNDAAVDNDINYGKTSDVKIDPIVSYNSADSGWRTEIKSERDSTFDVGYRADGDLGSFLARPVKIAQLTWSTASPLNTSIDPWSVFLDNPNVKRRIENYHLLRGDLEVKILINGNGFMHGRLLVDYKPLDSSRLYDSAIGGSFYLVQASQRPHIFLDPTTSMGGEMFLPYFYPKNWIELPAREYSKLGSLTLSTLDGLKHANGTVASANITIFACMKNVRLTIPTVNPVGSITPEGGNCTSKVLRNVLKADQKRNHERTRKYVEYIETSFDENGNLITLASNDAEIHASIKPEGGKDEYGKGIVSKPASIMAKMAGSITNVPVIGRYALASKIALDGIANVARIFGYSRPPIVNNITPAKLQSSGYNAYTDMDEVVAKLTVDSKQELSIDPRTVGLDGTDQMTIAHIASRESYFHGFNWSPTQTPETVLFTTNVTPLMFRGNGNPTNRVAMTPVCYASFPFHNWRGSLVYRFQIVASSFHKGRLRVTWDPTALGLFDASEYNIAYNRIVDLAEERDFEITVRWGQATAWREVGNPSQVQQFSVFADGNVATMAGRANGVLQVSVVNSLTLPNPTVTDPITVLCFVRAGDDFELANPSSESLRDFSWYDPINITPEGGEFDFITPESGEAINDVTDTGMSDNANLSPVTSDQLQHVGGDPIPDNDESLRIFYGEKISSIRQMLKRYCTHDFLHFNMSTSAYGFGRWRLLNYPEQRGWAFNSKTSDGTNFYNYTSMNYMNYFSPAYMGWKGGIRRKVTISGPNSNAVFSVARSTLALNANETGYSFVQRSAMFPYEPNTVAYLTQFDMGTGGRYQTDTMTNPTLEYELPFYSEYRFAYTQVFNDKKTLEYKPTAQIHEVMLTRSSTDQERWGVTQVAAGEDFSLFWFMNVPEGHFYGNPTYV